MESYLPALFYEIYSIRKSASRDGTRQGNGLAHGSRTVALSRLAYIVSSLVAVAGGTIYALTYTFDPSLQTTIAVTITIIAIVGGIGSVFGTVVVSLAFGLISALAGFFISPVDSVYIFYGILFAILFLRPQAQKEIEI